MSLAKGTMHHRKLRRSTSVQGTTARRKAAREDNVGRSLLADNIIIENAGVPLKDLLDAQEVYLRRRVKGRALVYVLQPTLDIVDGVLKFGRAGLGDAPHSALHRLWAYRHSYGDIRADNPCTGVRVYALVISTQSKAKQLEKLMIAHFKSERAFNRGDERIVATPAKVIKDMLMLAKRAKIAKHFQSATPLAPNKNPVSIVANAGDLKDIAMTQRRIRFGAADLEEDDSTADVGVPSDQDRQKQTSSKRRRNHKKPFISKRRRNHKKPFISGGAAGRKSKRKSKGKRKSKPKCKAKAKVKRQLKLKAKRKSKRQLKPKVKRRSVR
jgi:hypothetical protein